MTYTSPDMARYYAKKFRAQAEEYRARPAHPAYPNHVEYLEAQAEEAEAALAAFETPATTQEGTTTMIDFADDFTVTQEQVDTLNARIAAEKEATTMTTTTKQSQQEEALHTLREMIQEGQTVYATETQHHFMRFFIVSNRDSQLINITWYVGKALGHSVREHGYNNRWHVYRKGVGASLPNATVQGLAYTLFGDSDALHHSDI